MHATGDVLCDVLHLVDKIACPMGIVTTLCFFNMGLAPLAPRLERNACSSEASHSQDYGVIRTKNRNEIDRWVHACGVESPDHFWGRKTAFTTFEKCAQNS